jgi:ubiquilin
MHAPQNTQPQDVNVRYQSELEALQDMGFINTEENIRALTAAGGNLPSAVNFLLQNQNK